MARCPHCNARAVRRPSSLWKLAHAGAWIYVAGAVLGASLVGPFILLLGPVLLFSGTCLLAETYRRASESAVCEACDRYVATSVARPVVHVHDHGALGLSAAR